MVWIIITHHDAQLISFFIYNEMQKISPNVSPLTAENYVGFAVKTALRKIIGVKIMIFIHSMQKISCKNELYYICRSTHVYRSGYTNYIGYIYLFRIPDA